MPISCASAGQWHKGLFACDSPCFQTLNERVLAPAVHRCRWCHWQTPPEPPPSGENDPPIDCDFLTGGGPAPTQQLQGFLPIFRWFDLSPRASC